MQTNLNRPSFAPFSVVLAAMLLLSTGCTPSGPKALLQGEELIRKGKYEEAVEKLELATNLLPNEARAWNYLGLARHRAGLFADARLAYERALQLDRDLAAARFNLGKMYLDQGVPISALEQLSTFVMLEPKSVEGWVLMGEANLELLRYDEALNNYSSALRLQRDVPAAYNGIGLIYMKRKDPRKAYQVFVEALKYDSDYTPAILNLAVVLHTELDAKPLALAKYQEYLAKAPDAANLDAIRAVVRRLDLELNPPLAEEKPVVVAMMDTNQTQLPTAVSSAESTPAEPRKTETAVDSSKFVQTAEPKKEEPKKEEPKKEEPKKEVAAKPIEKKPEIVTPAPPVKSVEVPKKTEIAPASVPEKRPEQPKLPVKEVPPPVVEKSPEVALKEPVSERPKPVVAAKEPVAVAKEPVAVAKEPVAVAKEPVVAKSEPPAKAVQEPTPEKPAVDEPFEVVQLDLDGPSLTEDIPVPQETPSAPPELETTEPDLPVAASPVVMTPPPEEQEAPEKKRGFFQKINPVNLFRGSDDENSIRSEEIVTPLPPSSSPPPVGTTPPVTSGTRTVARAGEFTSVTPMRASEGRRRYSYSQSGPPRPGNRAAAERLFQRGLDAQAQLDPGRAASYFASAAMADPGYFPAQYNLGLLSYQTGQTMKSLSAFEAALALDPDSVEARYNFALSLQKTKYPLDAVNELNKLLASSPDNLRAHLLLGNVYAQDLDDIDRARSEYQKVLELDSGHPQAPAIRAWLNEHP